MLIPDHLVDLIRELAEVHHCETLGHVRTIEAYRSRDHADSIEARKRLERSRELCAHVGCSDKVIAA